VKPYEPTPEIEAARASLEEELVPTGVAERVLAIHDGQGFFLAVSILNESPENMARVAALPQEHEGLPVKPFRATPPADVEAARAALEARLVPDVARAVLAIHNGSTYVLTAVVGDSTPANLSKVTTPFQGLPVQAVLDPGIPKPS
jgi:hypothetical protein